MPKRTIPFLLVIGLFGVGLGVIVSTLDPLIYSEKIRAITPPTLRNTTLSFITIMALLVALLVQPVIGRWSDQTTSRWGKRIPYLVGGVLGLAISLTLIAFATNLWLLVIGAMLTAAASNTVQSVWQALIPDYVPESQRGLATALKTLLEVVGVLAGLTLAGITLTQGYLALTPLTSIALFVIILLITLSTLRKTDAATIASPAPVETKSQLSQAQSSASPLQMFSAFNPSAIIREVFSFFWARPAFLWWTINRILFWSAGIALRTFILNYFEESLSLSLADLEGVGTKFLVIIGGGAGVAILLAGLLADRLGRYPLLIAAGLLACGGTVLLLVVEDMTLLFVALGLIVVGAGLFVSASWALATDLAPKDKGALYLGLANGATVLGSISGRLGGPLIDTINHLSQNQRVGYIVVFTFAALCFAASSVTILKIRTLLLKKI